MLGLHPDWQSLSIPSGGIVPSIWQEVKFTCSLCAQYRILEPVFLLSRRICDMMKYQNRGLFDLRQSAAEYEIHTRDHAPPDHEQEGDWDD